ncbi:MAG: hypothetical protein QOK14_654 [Frankiaceae bacterium]|nr:hypothetical protein [Frankiaceae bacterium]
MRIRRTGPALATAALAILAVSGCSSSTRAESVPAAMPSAAAATGSPSQPSDTAAGGDGKNIAPTDGYVANPDVAPAAARQIVYTANLTVEAADVPTAVRAASQIATQLGGRIDSQKVENRTDGGHDATIVLKVPPAQYDEALTKLSALGVQRSLEQSTEDVTGHVADLESRVATEQKSIKRIRDFMDKATTIKDLVALESELTNREATMESEQAQANVLRGQAAMGTITASLVEKGVIAPPKPKPVHHTGFMAGLRNGWHALAVTFVATSTAVGALAPFALPALAVLGVWIVIRRRRREALPPVPPSEPATS